MEYSSLFVTLMGIGTVFFGLICIIFLTMAMRAILKGKEKAPAAAAAATAAAPIQKSLPRPSSTYRTRRSIARHESPNPGIVPYTKRI